MGKGRALQIRDVHSAWTSLLGVNCQIRREVSISFWKLNTIKLRPWTAGSLNSVLFAPKIDCLCDLPSVLLQISFRGKTITRLGFVERGGVYAKFRWCVCKGGWCPVVTIRKVLYFPNLSFRSWEFHLFVQILNRWSLCQCRLTDDTIMALKDSSKCDYSTALVISNLCCLCCSDGLSRDFKAGSCCSLSECDFFNCLKYYY